MKIVKVNYTVKSAFAQKNKENIKAFVHELEQINKPGIRYLSFVGDDGKTFTHISLYENEQLQKILLELGSFQSFQQQRDESGLEIRPEIEEMQLVASSFSILS